MVHREIPMASESRVRPKDGNTKSNVALGVPIMSNGYDKLVPVGPRTFKRRDAAKGYDSRDKRCTNCNRRLIAAKSQRDGVCAICTREEINRNR